MIHEIIIITSWFVIGFSSGVMTCIFIGYRERKRNIERRRKIVKDMTEQLDKMMEKLGYKKSVELEETKQEINQDESGKAVSPFQLKKEQ